MPYPNMAQLATANAGTCSKKVKIANMKVVVETTLIPASNGDEAGVAGGVVSGMNLGQAAFKLGSSMVKIEGMKCVYQNCITAHNGSNANMPAGAQVAPSQTSVKVAP
jgi:hypothetical protein